MDYTNEIINPFHYHVQVVLPLVYDDSLSYMEVLSKVRDKLNEVIDWANNYRDELKSYVDQKTLENLQQMQAELAAYKVTVDGELSGMQAQLDAITANLNQTIADFTNQITSQISEFQQQVNKQLQDQDAKVTAQLNAQNAAIKAEILKLTAQVNAQLSLVWQQFTTERNYMEGYVQMQLAALIDSLPDYYPVPVVCPANGQLMDLEDCLQTMYDRLRIFGLTCNEYDDLGLTCDQYDALALSCDDYDLKGEIWLRGYMQLHTAFSGKTGDRISIQRNLYELWQDFRENSLTAASYDALGLTAQAYDDKNVTAYSYDWDGNTSVAGNPEPQPPTPGGGDSQWNITTYDETEIGVLPDGSKIYRRVYTLNNVTISPVAPYNVDSTFKGTLYGVFGHLFEINRSEDYSTAFFIISSTNAGLLLYQRLASSNQSFNGELGIIYKKGEIT